MAEIIMPTGDLEDVEIELDQNFQVNRSAWTGRRRVSGMRGRRNGTVPHIATEDEERPWRLFLLSLRGPVHWFRFLVGAGKSADQYQSGIADLGSANSDLTNTANRADLKRLNWRS